MLWQRHSPVLGSFWYQNGGALQPGCVPVLEPAHWALHAFQYSPVHGMHVHKVRPAVSGTSSNLFPIPLLCTNWAHSEVKEENLVLQPHTTRNNQAVMLSRYVSGRLITVHNFQVALLEVRVAVVSQLNVWLVTSGTDTGLYIARDSGSCRDKLLKLAPPHVL